MKVLWRICEFDFNNQKVVFIQEFFHTKDFIFKFVFINLKN